MRKPEESQPRAAALRLAGALTHTLVRATSTVVVRTHKGANMWMHILMHCASHVVKLMCEAGDDAHVSQINKAHNTPRLAR